MGRRCSPRDDAARDITKSGQHRARGGKRILRGKMGGVLRAPDLWFEFLHDCGDKLAPLGEVAEVKFGVKSGTDCFFFPKDCSAECLAQIADDYDFRLTYHVARRDVASGKVKLVKCCEGRGEIRPIEAKYLEPEIHSLMEVKGYTVSSADCGRLILLVGGKRHDLKDKYVQEYIQWGESQGYNEGATCQGRVTDEREWFDLTGHDRGDLFWPMAQQYKHVIPINERQLICNHNLFDVTPKSVEAETLAGILNSTWVILSKLLYGRPVGVEGNLKTEVVDVKMMLVPDPRPATAKSIAGVAAAFDEMKKRTAMQLLSERRLREMSYTARGKEAELRSLSDQSELDMPDRRNLDDAVLELLGIRSRKRRREIVEGLHAYLKEYFELVRRKEEKAIINKTKYRRKGPAKPKEIAAQIYQEIIDNEGHLLKQDRSSFCQSVEAI